MAEVESDIFSPNSNSGFKLFKKSKSSAADQSDLRKDSFRNATQELNHRMNEARIPFHYHNRIFQYGTDHVTESQVYEPFWTIVKDEKWQNIDIDIPYVSG